MGKTDKVKKTPLVWDVIVIGSGPAGMMAAGQAGKRGLSVLILEKNPCFGKKLLLTGKGRCNITNNKTDNREMLNNYADGGKFLFSTFAQHSVSDTIAFFEKLGVPLKEENEGRMFPVSESAENVRDVLVSFIHKNNVHVQTSSEVIDISKDKNSGNFSVTLSDATTRTARACILAAGGTSHPETGSTGECFTWLTKLGHSTKENQASLVPIALQDMWAKNLSGLTLTECGIRVYADDKEVLHKLGKMLFTHFGVSGPLILNMSSTIRSLLEKGPVTLILDLVPQQNHEVLRTNIQTLLTTEPNRKLKNVLGDFIPSTLITPLLKLAEIDGDTPNHSVRAEDRKKLALFMKAVPLHVQGLLGPEKAIISSGGVSPTEVQFKTMESRIVPNLYLIGDVLNIDRPSGGYSLQLCWSTGYVAGKHVLE